MIHGVWEPRSSEHCHHHHGKETFQVNSTQNPNHQNWWTTKEKKQLREETSTAAASGTSGCRWMQMMATSYNNRSVDITHNQTTNITPIQNGSDSDFWNTCYNFSTMFSQIVCLFIVCNWESCSKQASKSVKAIDNARDTELSYLLDKQFGMFWNAHYKTSYRYHIFFKTNYSFF